MKLATIILVASLLVTRGQVQYTFNNFAGMPGGPGNVDGTKSEARFNPGSSPGGSLSGVAVDSGGNVYVADSDNHSVRKITPGGVVTTLAGNGHPGSNDGTGTAASFEFPLGVAMDNTGNLYVVDGLIRKISASGAVTTLANADWEFLNPSAVAVDGSGNLFVLDRGLPAAIWKITPNGVATIVSEASQFGLSAGMAVDTSGNVFVADTGNSIRKITPDGIVTTLAGGQLGSADGDGSAAQFNNPSGLAVDKAGNVYVADTDNGTIRKITPSGAVTTLAGDHTVAFVGRFADGTGNEAQFSFPTGLAVDSEGNVYVVDSGNCAVRKITPFGLVTTLAGAPPQRGSSDGTGSAARFSRPAGLALDAEGNIYVADQWNSVIRKITGAGQVTTLAGRAGHPGSADGTASEAQFNNPAGVAVDSAGIVYVADYANSTIRKITPTGTVTTLAGRAPQQGDADGTASDARFHYPSGLAVDRAGNVYVADTFNGTIRKISAVGTVTTVSDVKGDAARFYGPHGVAVDGADNVYVADTLGSTIRKITPSGIVVTLAGSANQVGSADGSASAAMFNEPYGVAVDGEGNVYVADSLNSSIRKITPSGMVMTLAGKAGQVGDNDGTGNVARFSSPQGVAVDSGGNVYVADWEDNRISKGMPIAIVPVRFQIISRSPTAFDAFLQVRLVGPSGFSVILESSTDLHNWIMLQTNALPAGGLALSLPLGLNDKTFYRAGLAP
jgi:sugar lactone lactonase YvrE